MTGAPHAVQSQQEVDISLTSGLWETLPQGMALLSSKGELLQHNPAFQRLLDTPAGGMPAWSALMSAEDRQKWPGIMAQLLSGAMDAYEGQVQLMNGKGRSQRYALQVWPLPGAGEDNVYLLVQLSGLSAEAGELNRLRENERQLNAIMQSEGLLTWVVDSQQRFTFLNRGWLDFSGQLPESVYGKQWSNGIHPQDQSRCIDILQRASDMHQPYTMEYRRMRFDGEYRWLRESGMPCFDKEGGFAGVSGTAINIEEMKQGEEQQLLSERRYRAIMEATADGFLFFDPDSGLLREVNDALCRITGYPKHRFYGMHLSGLFAPEHNRQVEGVFSGPGAPEHADMELHLLTRDGEKRFARLKCTRVVNPVEGDFGAFAFITDIHEKKLEELELQRAATVFETCNEGILISDGANRILSVNPAFTAITGYSFEEVRGKDPTFLNSGRQIEAFYAEMEQTLQEEGKWKGEVWNRRKNGEIYAEWLSISVLRDDAGSVLQHVAIFNDITQRKMAEELLLHQAEYDPLTDLLNRRGFFVNLRQLIRMAQRDQGSLALLFIDLDRFKSVNDSLGHAAGDDLLVKIAHRLRTALRKSDVIGRLGGDEFVVVMPAVHTRDEVSRVANIVLRELERPFDLGQAEAQVSGSIGIALYPEHALNDDALMQQADQAMYLAKSKGRGIFQFALPRTDQEETGEHADPPQSDSLSISMDKQ